MSAAAAESEPSFPSTSEHISEVFPPHACIICHQRIEETSAEKVTLGEKGSNTINNVSKDLQDTIHAEAGDLVHRSCRGSYINKKVIQAKLKEKKNGPSLRKRRQSRTDMDSLPLCLFCDKGEKRLSKGRGTLVPVRTMQFQQTVMCKCENRGDPWAQKVRAKIEFVQDCFASDTVYHNICYTNFRSGLQIPKVFMLTADAFQLPQILFHPDEEEAKKEESEESVSTHASLTDVLGLPLQNGELCELLDEDLGDDTLNTAQNILDNLLKGCMSAGEAANHEVFAVISDKLEQHKEHLANKRTAAMWLQYMKMIDIMRKSMKAERTGNFRLHLQSIHDMLPFLAAAGHNNYTKSGWLYLQQMFDLHNSHPAVYEFFSKGHHVVRRSDRFWGGISTDLAIEQILMRSLKSNGGLTRGTGIGEEERLVWLLCMPACAEIHEAMQSVTRVSFSSSEQHAQHKDVGKARQERDRKDIHIILKYLRDGNPFSGDAALRSICSGREADITVNVDQAENIGNEILSSMVGKNVSEVIFKKKDQAVTMIMKRKSSKVTEDITHVDSMLLFQRLVKVVENSPDLLEEAFAFEMSSVPTALFDSDALPRQANKASLSNYIWTTTKQVNAEPPKDVCYVIDGGFLLHLLTWSRGSTYKQLAQNYTDFVIRTFGSGTVVFDGYVNGPSTKDVAHFRRASRSSVACDISFDGDMLLCEPKDRFLANPNNKQRFINLMSCCMSQHGVTTMHATADAECLIVQTALDKARNGDVVVIGEDTDLLILLLFHFTPDLCSVFFTSARSSTAKSTAKIWNISATKNVLGTEICRQILFAHAFGGCDTISSIYSIGKSLPLKKVMESAFFRQQALVFTATPYGDAKQNVTDAGEKAFVDLYGGKQNDSLNSLRYVKYMQKVSTCSSSFQPCKLPPTSAAAKFHSMRTYFQVQEWMNLKQERCHLNPSDWGWEIIHGMMVPVLTDIAAAPDELLHVIHCNCKTECRTARCSCRKHGLVCTSGCGECRGESCSNVVSKIIYVGGDDSSDDEDMW